MNLDALRRDLKFILDHIHRDQDLAVKTWSQIECRDYQVPLAFVAGAINRFWISKSRVRFPIRDKPEYLAFAEIVQRSHLSEILAVDLASGFVELKDGVPPDVVEDIAAFVAANTVTIIN